eukprot:3772744-Pyramimonas_sp.AAC.1
MMQLMMVMVKMRIMRAMMMRGKMMGTINYDDDGAGDDDEDDDDDHHRHHDHAYGDEWMVMLIERMITMSMQMMWGDGWDDDK